MSVRNSISSIQIDLYSAFHNTYCFKVALQKVHFRDVHKKPQHFSCVFWYLYLLHNQHIFYTNFTPNAKCTLYKAHLDWSSKYYSV